MVPFRPARQRRQAGRLLCLGIIVGLLAGCNGGAKPCDEFAAPQERLPSSCPNKIADKAARKPKPPTRYCYQSLGDPDCYSEPQPGKPGYLGAY